MWRLPAAAALALPVWLAPALAAGEACPRQTRPAPLDAVHPIDSVYESHVVTFAAAPSLESPAGAWVVRVYKEQVFGEDRREREVLEVHRLQGEHDCNRWFNTGLWQAELEAGEVERIRAELRSFMQPAADAMAGGELHAHNEIRLDGTSIAVEMLGAGWAMTREGHPHGGPGKDVSDRFHDLAARLVPEDELPTRDWRRQP